MGGCGTDNVGSSNKEEGIQERTIKAGIGVQEIHPQGQALKKFAELVDQKSDSKLKVQTFFDGTLGDEVKMVESLKGGLQEITIPSTAPLVGTIKEFGLFDLPFVFNNEKEADTVLAGPLGQKLLEKLPEHKLVGLDYWESGFRHVTNSKHPITTAKDFEGLKIRTMQNSIYLEAYKALGANPTPMPFTEVFTSLESKTIDGQENSVPTIASAKLNEVQEYLSLTKQVYSPFVFLVSKKFWDQLSSEEQSIMKEAAVEAGNYQREINRASIEKALEDLKALGMKVNDVTPEERAKMKELTKPVIDQFTKEIGDDLVKELYTEVSKAGK
jgi:tripartite ATP-independent transporter DctP family solute receptor